MIEAGDVKKGTTLKLDGTLYRVSDTVYNKPGRGTATMQLTLVDIRTGNNSKRIFNSADRLDDIFVDVEQVEYLYGDSETLHFMNTGNYEQYEVPRSLFAENALYLKENLGIELKMYEGTPIDYSLPMTVTYKVTDAEVAVAGDSSGAVTKNCVTETGLNVRVPLFVNVGDTIKVDTRDGSYLTRV